MAPPLRVVPRVVSILSRAAHYACDSRGSAMIAFVRRVNLPPDDRGFEVHITGSNRPGLWGRYASAAQALATAGTLRRHGFAAVVLDHRGDRIEAKS
jgi:hypothetical protein